MFVSPHISKCSNTFHFCPLDTYIMLSDGTSVWYFSYSVLVQYQLDNSNGCFHKSNLAVLLACSTYLPVVVLNITMYHIWKQSIFINYCHMSWYSAVVNILHYGVFPSYPCSFLGVVTFATHYYQTRCSLSSATCGIAEEVYYEVGWL